jgi:hypothetical protein
VTAADRSIVVPILALTAAASACTGDTDPPWQLDHDRIVAVRATPPRIAAGELARVDGLVARKGAPVVEQSPDSVTVASPASLVGAVSSSDSGWTITAPDADQLAAARAELGLAAGALIPLELRVGFAGGARIATKTVWLGGDADNPAMTGVTIDRATAGAAEIVVDPGVDVPLSIGVDDATYDVTWLSSCGTMHDFDLPSAHLRVEADDPTRGQLVLVVRDATGGVNWQIWPIRTR